MRAFLLVSISFLLLSFIGEQKQNDLQKLGLKANVRKVIERTYYHVDEDPVKHNTPKSKSGLISLFDLHGNEIESGVFGFGDSSLSSTTYKYDSKGEVIEFDEFAPHKKLLEKTENKYDTNGNLVEQTISDNNLWYKYYFKYASGNLTEKDYYDSLNKIGKYCYSYDNNGSQVEESYYYPLNVLCSKKIFKYDKAGNEIEFVEYNSNPNKNSYSIIRKFDKKGNEIEIKNFNEKGELIDDINYKYKYDKNANWIKRTRIEKKKAVEITEREIEYY